MRRDSSESSGEGGRGFLRVLSAGVGVDMMLPRYLKEVVIWIMVEGLGVPSERWAAGKGMRCTSSCASLCASGWPRACTSVFAKFMVRASSEQMVLRRESMVLRVGRLGLRRTMSSAYRRRGRMAVL